jgi:predicted nuclease of predicted toxin-antitoxin system
MKLLLDQNLSRKLVDSISDLFPESCHLTAVLPESSDDRTIWNYAKDNGFIIVTKDDDFEQRSILYGHPPKVIWIRLGNCKTEDIEALLKHSFRIVAAFGDDDEKSLLPIP